MGVDDGDFSEYIGMTTGQGTLVVERYLEGTRTQDRLLGNSATKSALALLVGQAVDDGRLPDLDTPVTGLVPELRGTGYAAVTLRHLLTMTSGVGLREDYHDPASPASRRLGVIAEQPRYLE